MTWQLRQAHTWGPPTWRRYKACVTWNPSYVSLAFRLFFLKRDLTFRITIWMEMLPQAMLFHSAHSSMTARQSQNGEMKVGGKCEVVHNHSQLYGSSRHLAFNPRWRLRWLQDSALMEKQHHNDVWIMSTVQEKTTQNLIFLWIEFDARLRWVLMLNSSINFSMSMSSTPVMPHTTSSTSSTWQELWFSIVTGQ